MNTLIALIATVALTTSPYTADLTRYFPNDATEQTERATLLANVAVFEKQTASTITTPKDLASWLSQLDSLSKGLQKHDLYVYMRAEGNRDDRPNAAADEALGDNISRLDSAARNILAELGPSKVHGFLNADPLLAPYRHFIDDSLARAAHDRQSEQAVLLLAQPALDSLGSSYKTLRRHALSSAATHKPESTREAPEARWTPFLQNEDGFAALLLPIATLQNGKAKLQGFVDAPEAAYFRAGLSPTAVHDVLLAVGRSDAYSNYQSVVAGAAALKLHVAKTELRASDLDASDTYAPPRMSFPDAVSLILAATKPMGVEYARQYAQLFDPAAHRVMWCHEDKCDDTGFSVGYAGLVSGLFYGKFDGSVNSVRGVAHEAGHAVHRQFMNENQPLAVYNEGPHFVFESFAIFNELLLLDHLYRSASSPNAKAYYLHTFLNDATAQVFGSARETDLEESMYAGVQAGSLRTAADMDALTLQVFARYTTAPALAPEMKVFWAANRLYFTDPLYDVNYLFAGLLALEYLHQYEQDPRRFASRYVALLKNGFTDTPQVLERKFLDIDLDDAGGLVGNAAAMISHRTTELSKLYSAATP